MKRFLPQNFNDFLALLVFLGLGVLLLYLAIFVPDMRRDVFILAGPWGTLVIQFYFRKAKEEKNP